MKKIIILLIFLLFGLQTTNAQNTNQKTAEIQISVKTEFLEKKIQSQQLLVEINKNNNDTTGYFGIEIKNTESTLTLVSAKRNNEDLWLLNSKSSVANENVLAWNFDKNNSKLILYPYNWNSPYLLDLNIQVNLKNISTIESNSSPEIILTAEVEGKLFEANPTGQGNKIQIR